jgi:GTP-binding protein Era
MPAAMTDDTTPTDMMPTGEPVRVGVCAILGLANVGKSTLLNQILGVRLAAVSQRPQTTRNRILGVRNLTLDDPDLPPPREAQLIFVDTPGVQVGHSPLRKYMRDQSLSAAGDCDLAVLMLDVTEKAQRRPESLHAGEARALTDALAATQAPIILALNKIDQLSGKDQLLPVIEAYHATGRYAEIVPISAQRGDGVDRVIAAVARRLPIGPRLFPEDMYTDRAERFLAGELVREQLFRQLGKEVPYATAVVVEAFEERRERGDVMIHAVIHVEKASQKGIVVGKGGARIKELGIRAREAIGELLGCAVHLKLHVKVSPDWSRAERTVRDMGYD